MAIPQINPYDYFYQWREKTNLLATLMGDVETIEVAEADRDTLVEALNKVISNIGLLSTLTTTAKNTIVAAINEHQTKLGNATLTTTAQDVTSAINELDGEHGILANLTTTAKNTIVAAINELDGEHGTLSSLTTTYKATFVGAINELVDKIGPLSTLSTTDKDNAVEAINEVLSKLGTIANLTTTAKTSAVAAINEHDGEIGNISTLTTTDKDNLVDAVNELDGEHGVLSTLTTNAKSTFVGAINELDNEMGDLTTLKTVTKSSTVHAINELFDSLLIGNATFTVGTETDDVIRVAVQLKDRAGANLAIAAGVQAYLSDNSNGLSLVATAPSGGWAIGTTGVLIPNVANKAATFICSSSGVFNVDITEVGAKTAYLVVILPLGNLKISSAITFAE
jgi:hypothetical protein